MDGRSGGDELFDSNAVGCPNLDRIPLPRLILLHPEDQIRLPCGFRWRKVLDRRSGGAKRLIDAPLTSGFTPEGEQIYALVRVARDAKPVLYVFIAESRFRLGRRRARLNTGEATSSRVSVSALYGGAAGSVIVPVFPFVRSDCPANTLEQVERKTRIPFSGFILNSIM